MLHPARAVVTPQITPFSHPRLEITMQNTPKTISRRTVASGLAWSVPAVATVAAAPAFAASPRCINASAGDVVKYPGNSGLFKQGYGFELTVTNPTEGTVAVSPGTGYVQFDKKRENGTVRLFSADPCKGGKELKLGDELLVLEPGESITLWLVLDKTGNSANDSGCVVFNLKVRLVSGTVGGDGLCDTAPVTDACFGATTPQGSC